MNPRSHVFISYARADGEDCARIIAERLEAEHVSCWRDRLDLTGGEAFWPQLVAGISNARWLLVVLSPAALQSEWTAAEWREARKRGVPLCPVWTQDTATLGPLLARSALPLCMQRTHIYTPFAEPELSATTDEQWRNLVATLRVERDAAEAPNMAPLPPVSYVPRTSEMETLIQLLAGASQVIPTVVLRGLGGYGKSSLVKALAGSDAVKDTFCDGVLWATLGTKPNLLSTLRDICRKLGSLREFDSIESTQNHLRGLLVKKRCLLVVDDAWHVTDMQMFLRLAPEVVTLITTRVAEVANADPAASRITLGEMTPDQATEVLRKALSLSPTSNTETLSQCEARCRALATRLGHWPLLLTLAAGQIREQVAFGESADGALTSVEDNWVRAGVTALDGDALSADFDDQPSRSLAFATSIGGSLSLLKDHERNAFVELGIFDDDVAIPLATAGQLWKVQDPKRVAMRLANLSLIDLQLGERPLIRVHDLILRFAAQQLRHHGSWRDTHRRLVDAWKKMDGAPDGLPWRTDTGDEYFYRHLATHLTRAGMFDEVAALFDDDRWLKLRVNFDGGDYAGYCSDLNVARDVAATLVDTNNGGIEQQFRYALVRTSVNSVAEQCPTPLVVRAAQTGLWRPDRVLNVLSRMPIPSASSTIVALLQQDIPSNEWRGRLVQFGLEIARADWVRCRAALTLSAILPDLTAPERFQIADEARVAAWEVAYPGDHRGHVRALLALIPELTDGEQAVSFARSVTLARETPVLDERIECLSIVATHGASSEAESTWELTLDTVQERLEQLQGSSPFYSRRAGELLLALVPHVPSALLNRVAHLGRQLPLRYLTSQVLTRIAERLSLDARLPIISEAFEIAKREDTPGSRVIAIATVAPYLTGTEARTAIEVVRQSEYPEWIALLGRRMTGGLSADLIEAALSGARRAPGPAHHCEALSILLPLLPSAQRDAIFDEAFRAARRDPTPYRRSEALSLLVEPAPATGRTEVLRALVRELKTSVGADWSPNNVLERVAPHLEGDILLAALDATAVIADDKERVDALRTAIPFVNPEVVRLVLNHASHVGDERARGSLLTSIADRADDESIDLLIAQVRSIEWRSWRVEPLEHLLPSLSADRRSEVLEDLLVAANDLGFESDRVKTLGRVVRMMPPDLIDRGLWLARGIEAPGLRSEALLVLSRGTQATLGETDRDALLNEALETAYDVEDAFSRTFLLAEAATFYPPGDRRRVLWEEALSSARSTPDLETRAHLFRLLAARSSGEEERRSLFSESLHNAQQIESVSRRASAILPLVHDLTSGDRDAFIADVHRTRPTVESLTIVEKLIEVYRDEDAAFALSILDACDPGWGTTERIRLLEMIAGSLTDVTPFVDRFVDECRAIDTHHVERASLLLELARRLGRPNGVRAIDEAIQLLRSADSPVKRTELLAVVAEHLPSGERALVIGETLREAQQIENVFDRAWTLWTLGTLLSSSERYAVWHEALRCFNSESRKDVLALFRATCATPSTPSDLLGRMAALVVEVDERWSWL